MKLKFNGKEVEAREGATILEAARANGVLIPTLCHFPGLNEVGACRICVVEVKGAERLVAACNTKAAEGMEIETASKRVLDARKANLRLILSEHDGKCPTCPRNGNCALQTLAANMGIMDEVAVTTPIVRNDAKCVKCMRCIEVCEKIQGQGVWALLGSGKHARVGVADGARLEESKCVYCGQCVTHCPVGALSEADEVDKLLAAIHDPAKTVVLQVAPAVRAAWGEGIGLPAKAATEKRMAAVFRRLGVDYVFDTNFSADLTIMEEGNELLKRLAEPAFKRPMFTSCCPGWVRFLEKEYPELLPQLSTAKSPQQMFGAIAKSYFAEKIGKDRKDVFCVSVMPCTAKKHECKMDDTVDLVLTTREVDRLIRRLNLNVFMIPEEDFDSPLGTGSGAAVIFGRTGGVMEAALRTVATVKGVDLSGVRTKVVSGLNNARALIEDIKAGRAEYDFVEVMACPGGCAGGGGQPIVEGCEMAEDRGAALNAIDGKNPLHCSHENPEVITLYKEFLGEPLSEKSHELLHVHR